VFERIRRRGRRLHGTAIVLHLMSAEPALLPPADRGQAPSPWRCGVVVSGKVSRRAVERNRLRRRLHAHLLAHLPRTGPPLWLLLSLRPGSAELPADALLGECDDLLRRAGLTP
jgi:ribonuclease P protein component